MAAKGPVMTGETKKLGQVMPQVEVLADCSCGADAESALKTVCFN